MDGDPELAIGAVKTAYDLWSVDSDCVEWVGDTDPDTILKRGYGFDWWPGDFKVAVRVSGPHPEIEVPVYRLSIRTDFLVDVDATRPEVATGLTTYNLWAPTFTICGHPNWKSQFAHNIPAGLLTLNLKSTPVWLAGTAYLNRSTKDWLPRLFAGLSILQPIESQARIDDPALVLGGRADRSNHPRRGARTTPDSILGVEADIATYGKKASSWIESNEFQGIIDRWGETETTFGMADEAGLFIETPFGNGTALLRLRADQPHPRLGSGLMVVLKTPVMSSAEDTEATCILLNWLECTLWQKAGFPLIGNWCATEDRDPQGALTYYPSFRCFIPSMAHQPGIAENIALYMIVRARWARKILLPDFVDRSMEEILSERLQILRPS